MQSPGELRRRARKRDERVAKLAAMRAAGLSCANCIAFQPAPWWMSGHICDHDSDHEGYAVAKPNGLCTNHKPSNG